MKLEKFQLIKDLSEFNYLRTADNVPSSGNGVVCGLELDCGAEKVTLAFVSGLNGFYLKICEDFDLFCEFFSLDPIEPSALEKFYELKRLAKMINQFSLQELGAMMTSGWRLEAQGDPHSIKYQLSKAI